METKEMEKYWLHSYRWEEKDRLVYELYSSEEAGNPAFPKICIEILCDLLDGCYCVTNFYNFADTYLRQSALDQTIWGKSKKILNAFSKIYADAFCAQNESAKIWWSGRNMKTSTFGADKGTMRFFLNNPGDEYILHHFCICAYMRESSIPLVQEMDDNVLAQSCDIYVFYEEKQDRLLMNINPKVHTKSVLQLVENAVKKYEGNE